ncbi:phosphotransferase [Nocardioides sp. GY 10127]|uniref:phosphotransferase family protein n=1 Tax=Nocardioides sp. GY 10127 TaxID=2569762 RepID=UPI0010A8AF3F|nr:phosphotransferase [Nocardioides sp. GY 10127]TIC82763.1 hypothetical protein E8D37_08730 [Nocardioides sp. GY 10127]
MTFVLDPSLAPADPTMASPSWWGADSTRERGTLDGRPAFAKVHTLAAAAVLDLGSAFAATSEAGRRGVGPTVLSADLATRTQVFEDLTDSHATGTLLDLEDRGRRADLAAARRSTWDWRPEGVRTATVFDDVRALLARLAGTDAALPPELGWMLRVLDDAESRISGLGTGTAFIHGDSTSSNLMIPRTGPGVVLVDWDWATFADPLQDVGSLLLELSFTPEEARSVFALVWGEHDDAAFARAQLYRAAEAVRGGLVGTVMDHLDPGTAEYSKFADWMFLRARIALGEPGFDDYLSGATR